MGIEVLGSPGYAIIKQPDALATHMKGESNKIHIMETRYPARYPLDVADHVTRSDISCMCM